MLSDAKKSRLKIRHDAEGLFFVPKGLNDYRLPVTKGADLINLPEGQKKYIQMKVVEKGKIESLPKPRHKQKKQEVLLQGTDGVAVKVYLFGNVWDWTKIGAGEIVNIFGEIKDFGGPALANPAFVTPKQHGKLAPIYRPVAGSATAATVLEAVENAKPFIKDATSLLTASIGLNEAQIASVSGFESISVFLSTLHSPKDISSWEKAREAAHRLAKEEVLQIARRVKSRPHSKDSVLLVNEVEALSPKGITLTKGQERAISEIVDDIRSPIPMMRLLSGDVGTGKTLCFAGPAAAANKIGHKVAIIAPTEILVTQIVNEIKETFPGTLIETVTSLKKPNISENPILVGTSALINFANKNKWVADLLIIDEQHKMSREQRESIADSRTNILESTATAIPRSLALITHGGMDVSILREAPVKREIKTAIVNPESRSRIYSQIENTLNRGEQVAIVYALVEDNKDIDALSIESSADNWEKFAPGRVLVVHGKMKADEKTRRINAMKNGEYDIMVCSTVIEVGITIPKLTTMVIVDPDRQGLAQLHQLRGRASRKGGDGVMLLYPSTEISEKAYERLNALVQESDGFKLSEIDMRARGFGDLDLNSDNQNGETKFCFRGIQLSIDYLLESQENSHEMKEELAVNSGSDLQKTPQENPNLSVKSKKIHF